MPKWNFAAMGQAGLTGRTRDIARLVALRSPAGPGAEVDVWRS